MYTIGQVSQIYDLPISTLRYYDKEGLFPGLKRESGRRQFGDNELEALKVIECLKASGLEIKDIKQFMEWCQEGPATYSKRKDLFENRKLVIEAEIARLQRNLDMINFKCWYYEQALAQGTEDQLQQMIPDKLPPGIQELYDSLHEY